jgi:hypothetical protein
MFETFLGEAPGKLEKFYEYFCMMHDTHPQTVAVKRTLNKIVHKALISVKNKTKMFEG